MTQEMRYVFVDADSILFSAAYAPEKKVPSHTTMFKRYQDKINYIKTHTFANEMYVAVKGLDNFRDKIDPEYKANRRPLADDLKERLKICHAYALEQGAVQCDGWEADDQVRAWAWEAQEDDIPWVIAGIDKDLLQIPGTHFNYGGSETKPKKEEDKWKFIDQEEGDFRFAGQLITGDTVDNIKGIRGMGPKKAEKALTGRNRKDMMNVIMNLYQQEYGTGWEERLNKNCNLIYMRRWLDDEFDYKEWLNG